jgi:hypothetical protein
MITMNQMRFVSMLPFQGANRIVGILTQGVALGTQGVAIGLGYIGLSARKRTAKGSEHALKGQHNLAQRRRPGGMGIRNKKNKKITNDE